MLCSRILVAYDGSDLGSKALEMAIELANTNKSIEINVIHVVEYPPAPMDYGAYMYVDLLEKAKEQGKLTIAKAEERLADIPNVWQTLVVEGQAEQAILDQSKQLNCDMIIMGSRGLSGLKELFLGSVSHHVTQHSPVPVLIVK